MRFGKHKKVKHKDIAENSLGDEEARAKAAMEAQYKRKPKRFYLRKNARLALAALQSALLLPRRIKRGPIYPSYNKRLEVYYRAVMKVADHHYLLSWDDLRNLYPVPRIPHASYVRKVTLPCGLRGEFVCWVPKDEAREIKKQEKAYEELKARHEKKGGDLPEESPYFRNKPTIMFIHGGGFCIGTVPSYRTWCWKLSKLLGGMQFFLPDYTLSPEVTFPVALKQCWRAYLWLLNPKGGGIPADRLIIAGDSAGGNLTLSLLYVIRQVRLEKERAELDLHRQRRLSCTDLRAAAAADATADAARQRPREWTKGPVELWIEKEREREEVVPSEAVEKVLQSRKTPTRGRIIHGRDDVDDVDADADAAEADRTSEARWPAHDLTESQQRAWERRTLASDDTFMHKHRLPFELAPDERDIFPPMPLAAILLSPWVDLSEHSSAFLYRSYPQPEKFRPYHIGLRFVQGYLNLQPSDYPFTKRKERELRRPLKGGLKAQKQERYAVREKDRARLKWEKKRWERKYLKQIVYEELRLRQVDRDERRNAQRRRESLLALREEEQEAERERSNRDLRAKHPESETVPQRDAGAGQRPHDAPWDRRRSLLLTQLADERGKERNKCSIYSPYISPVYGDLLGLPPLLITGGDVEPLWEDIRTVYQKAVDQGVEAELYIGHHMNHDFQFFFNIMPHPAVDKFFVHVKDWLHQRMDIRKQRDAGLSGSGHSLRRSTATSQDAPSVVEDKPINHFADSTTTATLSRAEEEDKGKEKLKDLHHQQHPHVDETAALKHADNQVKVTVLPAQSGLSGVAPTYRYRYDDDLEAVYATRTPLNTL